MPNLKAVIIELGEGFFEVNKENISLEKVLTEIVQEKITIVLLNYYSRQQIESNFKIGKLQKKGVIFMTNLLSDTAKAKMSFLLGNFQGRKKIEKKFQKNMRGELY